MTIGERITAARKKAVNPYPGACVCVVRWNGDIIYDKPHAYDAYKQGDSPGWRELKRREEKKNRTFTERRPAG